MEDKAKTDKEMTSATEQEIREKTEKELFDRIRREEIEEKSSKYYLNSWRRGGINE